MEQAFRTSEAYLMTAARTACCTMPTTNVRCYQLCPVAASRATNANAPSMQCKAVPCQQGSQHPLVREAAQKICEQLRIFSIELGARDGEQRPQ